MKNAAILTSLQNKPHQVCKRCIIDTTVPGHDFDEQGICAYCRLHERLEKQFPLSAAGEKTLQGIIQKMKKRGEGNKYDCVVGISGGRDSVYTLYMAKKVWGLRPIAVHFNDGFGNPTAGENMKKATDKLGVELRTITSDWRESKDLRIAFLKASTPDLGTPTDIGIATALYSVAYKEKVQYVVIGQSFRTEGIAPLEWNYLDGKYIKSIHKEFGSFALRKWSPLDPGFNLGVKEMIFYTVLNKIKTVPLLYYHNYIRKEAEEVIKKEFDWVYPGAHYYDDLYQSLMTYVMRKKFNIDRRIYNYSALVRSGQMDRAKALESIKEVYVIEDPKVIDLCIKRLGLTKEQFEEYMKLPPKSFRDYPTSYDMIRLLKWPIKICARLNLLPATTHDKYFTCG